MKTEEREQQMQRLLDEFGYVVIAHDAQHPVRSVLDECTYSNGDPFGFPVVVVGYTTAGDFLRQVRFLGTDLPERNLAEELSRYDFFHKVVAE